MAATIFQVVSVIVLINVECVYAPSYMRACFFNSNAKYNPRRAKFRVQDIDFTLCTHYIYNYALIDIQGKTILPADRAEEEGHQGLYKNFTGGKGQNYHVKTVLSVGGPGSSTASLFESLHAQDTSFQTFAQNAMQYVKHYDFNGINIHWEVQNENSGKTLLPQLLQKLKNLADMENDLIVTMTGYGLPTLITSKYDVQELQKHLDFVFVQCHDMVNPQYASFIGPLFNNKRNPSSAINMNDSLHLWKAMGMPFNKLVMSVTALGNFVQLADTLQITPGSAALAVVLTGPTYLLDNRLAYPENDSLHLWKAMGMPFNKLVMSVTALGNFVQLADTLQITPGSAALAVVLTGPTYHLDNRLAYPEICEKVPISRRFYDNIEKNAYLVQGFFWIGYTDPQSLGERLIYMQQYGLGGIAFSNLDEDDFNGTACNAGTFPLVTFIRQALNPVIATTTVSTSTATSAATTATRQATTELHTHATSPTTIESTSLSTTAPKKRDSNEEKTGVLKSVLFVVLFAVGHIVGHLFMLLARRIYHNSSPRTDKTSPSTDIKSSKQI